MGRSGAVDFLGVGAQRSATTWLANSLRSHPDVWLPPRKELHYFSRAGRYPSASYLDRPRTLSTAIRDLYAGNAAGKRLRRDLRSTIGHGRLADLPWLYRYYARTTNDSWYLSLFRDARLGQIAGELTPDYSLLEADDVARVAELLPNVKALIVLRHPIDRAWSQYRHDRGLPDATDQQVLQFLASPSQTLRSDYVRIVSTWRGVLGAANVWVAIYDDIVAAPSGVLADLAGFLGVDPTGFQPAAAVNAARPGSLRPAVASHLAATYLPMVMELDGLVRQDLKPWIERCRREAKYTEGSS